MAVRLTNQKYTKLHGDLREEFDQIFEVAQDERRQAVEDRRFYSISGAQWEDGVAAQVRKEMRVEANKIHASVIRIFSEYRENRISVMFRPDDSDTPPETAETLTGMYRSDEQKSVAQEAYDNGFEEGVGGGIGAWRLRVVYDDDEYADEYDEEAAPEDDPDAPRLRVAIEPIVDADSSVYWSLDGKRFDKADATKCYVLCGYTRAAYSAKWPGISPADWPSVRPSGLLFDWVQPDMVYVAEVFIVEKVNDIRHIFKSTITGQEMDLEDSDLEDAEYMKDLTDTGFVHARDAKIKRRRIRKLIMSGLQILEDCGYINGKCIPIIQFFGKRWYVDGIERSMGHVRLGKDMQRLLNMMLSRLGEIASLTPYEVPILTPEQVRGHQTSWAQGNVERKAYRLINAIKDGTGATVVAPVGYLKPPDVPPALSALTEATVSLLDSLQGTQPEQEQTQANVSAKAVQLIQNRIDMKTFIYTDNMAKAMRRSGEVWLSIMKDIAPDGPYKARTLDADGSTQSFVDMNTQTISAETSKQIALNDVRSGKFGVYSDVGPSFVNRRDATVSSLLNILGVTNPQDQTLATVILSSALMNMDGEGLDDLRDYLRKKLVAMGAVKPTKEETQELQQEQANQPPDPNSVFLLAEADKSRKLGNKALADGLASIAKAFQTRAAGVNQLAQARLALAKAHGETIDPIFRQLEMLQAEAAPAEQPQQQEPAPTV